MTMLTKEELADVRMKWLWQICKYIPSLDRMDEVLAQAARVPDLVVEREKLLAVVEAVIGEHGIAERIILIEKAIAYREAQLTWEDDATRRASLQAQNAGAKKLAAALRALEAKGE